MSYLTPPEAFTGVTINLANPGTVGNSPAPAQIQIRNASGWVIQTTSANGREVFIDPFTAVTIPLNVGQTPVTLVGAFQAYTGLSNGYVSAEWLLNGESPSEPDGPLTSAATIATITGTINANIVGGTVDIGAGTVDVGTVSGNVSIFAAGQETLVQQDIISAGSWSGGQINLPITIPLGAECISVSFDVPSGGPYTNQIAINVQLQEHFLTGPLLGETATSDDIAILSDNEGAIKYNDAAVVDCLSNAGSATLNLLDINSQTPATLVTVVAYPYPASMVRGRGRLSRQLELTNYPEPIQEVVGVDTIFRKGMAAGVKTNIVPAVPAGSHNTLYEIDPVLAVDHFAAGINFIFQDHTTSAIFCEISPAGSSGTVPVSFFIPKYRTVGGIDVTPNVAATINGVYRPVRAQT